MTPGATTKEESSFPPPLILTGTPPAASTEKEQQQQQDPEDTDRSSVSDSDAEGRDNGGGVLVFDQDVRQQQDDAGVVETTENLSFRKDVLEYDRTSTTATATTTSLDGSTTSSCCGDAPHKQEDYNNHGSPSNGSYGSSTSSTSSTTPLSNLCIHDATIQGSPRIEPNSSTGEPYIVENDLFRCEVRFMVRTPKKDRKKEVQKNPFGGWGGGATRKNHDNRDPDNNNDVSKHFEDKKRMFEFQFRAKLKKMPSGPLYLGCELEQPVKLKMIQRALCSTCLNFVKKLNNGFHYSFGTTTNDVEEGRYERTHLSFALESCMDLIIATKPGDPLPPLGTSSSSSPLWHEPQESISRRKKLGRGSVDWNTEDTYTMALWSAYIDWVDWKTCNLPGIRPFSLTDISGKQPIHLTVYSLKTCDHSDDVSTASSSSNSNKTRRSSSSTKKKLQQLQQEQPHYRRDVTIYADIEMSHLKRTERNGL